MSALCTSLVLGNVSVGDGIKGLGSEVGNKFVVSVAKADGAGVLRFSGVFVGGVSGAGAFGTTEEEAKVEIIRMSSAIDKGEVGVVGGVSKSGSCFGVAGVSAPIRARCSVLEVG